MCYGGASRNVSLCSLRVGDIPDGIGREPDSPMSQPHDQQREVVENGLQTLEPTVTRQGKDPYGNKTFSWWFFTWNNPPHDAGKKSLLQEFGKTDRYIKFQYEKGKEGTLHYQGVLYNRKKRTATQLQKKFSTRAYLAPVINTDAALRYCGKADTRVSGPWTAGKLPAQGQRSDLLECKSIIDAGGGVVELYQQQFSNMIRYGRGLRHYIEVAKGDQKRTWDTKCYVYYGKGGNGKTEAVKVETERWGGGTWYLTLEAGNGGKLWWGDEFKHYNGEHNIVIDEFEYGNNVRISDLKRLIDSTPLDVPFKGGFTPFLGRRVWLLSNYAPATWYSSMAPGSDARGALERRLHYMEAFYERYPGLGEFKESRRFFVDCQRDGTYDIDLAPRAFAPARNAYDMPILGGRGRR